MSPKKENSPSKRTFINLTPQEAAGVYPSIYQNAIRLKRDSLYLIEKQSYSTATSLLILSLEEIIKTIIIYLHSQEYAIFKNKKIGQIFTNHKSRHNLAITIDSMNAFTILFNKWTEARELQKKEPKKERSSIPEKTIFEVCERICLLFNDEEINQFNDYKNSGFYVDYLDQLQLPQKKITRTTYEKVMEVHSNTRRMYKFLLIIHNPKAKQNKPDFLDYDAHKKQLTHICESGDIDLYHL